MCNHLGGCGQGDILEFEILYFCFEVFTAAVNINCFILWAWLTLDAYIEYM